MSEPFERPGDGLRELAACLVSGLCKVLTQSPLWNPFDHGIVMMETSSRRSLGQSPPITGQGWAELAWSFAFCLCANKNAVPLLTCDIPLCCVAQHRRTYLPGSFQLCRLSFLMRQETDPNRVESVRWS